MQKSFDNLRQILIDFIEQRDRMVLYVATPEAEAALMLKVLLDLQHGTQNDLFYLLTEPFWDANSYVDVIANRLEAEYVADSESGGSELLPVPEECFSRSGIEPAKRLQHCFANVRSLLPTRLGHRIVWGMAPTEIANESAWRNFIGSCVPVDGIEPWMRGLRWVVRFPQATQRNEFSNHPRAKFIRFAIPQNAAENELRESLQTSLPSDDRARALVQVAYIDLAHNRTSDAVTALRETLAIGQQIEDPALQTLAMLGLGDAAWRQRDLDEAKYWYECAIIPAGETKQIMSLSIIADRLGDIAFQERRFSDSQVYYEQLVILKRVIPDEHGLVDALLKRCRAEQQLANPEASIVTCHEALLLCLAFPNAHVLDTCLDELLNAYTTVGRRSEGERERAEWKMAFQGASI